MTSEHSAEFPRNWQAMLNEMQGEWRRLHAEIAALRDERDMLSKALLSLLDDDADDIDGQEILAQIGSSRPLREFLRELRSTYVKE